MKAKVPVMIHLHGEMFLHLERIAMSKRCSIASLIEAGIERSLQPKPQRVAGQIAAPPRATGRGYRRLNNAEWARLKHLRDLGWTVPELAIKYGCSSASIYRRLRREARS